MTDYYLYSMTPSGIYCQFLLRCKDVKIAREAIRRAFEEKALVEGAFGIEVDTQTQTFQQKRAAS